MLKFQGNSAHKRFDSAGLLRTFLDFLSEGFWPVYWSEGCWVGKWILMVKCMLVGGAVDALT